MMMNSSSNSGMMESMSRWDGTLSWDEFCIAARAFAEQWTKFNSELPQFSWVPRPKPTWLHPNSQSEGYLSVDNVLISCNAKESCNEEAGEDEKEELRCSDNDGFVDPATLAQNDEISSHFGDFHIIYNVSFRVPVLYFRSYRSDGQVLGLDDILKSIPSNAEKLLKESKWTFITQEDHPYLNRPWYTLHPCGTSEWMKILFDSDPAVAQGGVTFTKYLVSWFSVVGQVFGLKIPFQMLGLVKLVGGC